METEVGARKLPPLSLSFCILFGRPPRPYLVGRTLLIGNPQTSWREWLREHRGDADLLCLDPGEPTSPARFVLWRANRPVYSRFYGSLDPQRAPHALVAALAQALPRAGHDLTVQLFAYRPTPLMRQTVQLAAQVLQPTEILVAKGTLLHRAGFAGACAEVELESVLPPAVQAAQRKAQWMKLLEEAAPHEVDLNAVAVEGARYGSGEALGPETRARIGLESARHAEKTGNTLFVVADEELDERDIARALDDTHCTKAQLAHPSLFENLLCSFARQTGEDFGLGLVQSIDWPSRTARILCTAVPPAPVRILRLGSLRIDREGNELGEVRSWQV